MAIYRYVAVFNGLRDDEQAPHLAMWATNMLPFSTAANRIIENISLFPIMSNFIIGVGFTRLARCAKGLATLQ